MIGLEHYKPRLPLCFGMLREIPQPKRSTGQRRRRPRMWQKIAPNHRRSPAQANRVLARGVVTDSRV